MTAENPKHPASAPPTTPPPTTPPSIPRQTTPAEADSAAPEEGGPGLPALRPGFVAPSASGRSEVERAATLMIDLSEEPSTERPTRRTFFRRRAEKAKVSQPAAEAPAATEKSAKPIHDSTASASEAAIRPAGPAPEEAAPAGSVAVRAFLEERGRQHRTGLFGRRKVEAPAPQDPKGTAEPERPGVPSERPPGVPEDPWTAFVMAPEKPPGLVRRASRAFGRSLIHEYALAVYSSLVLAVVLTWPTLRYPLHTLPQDLGDPSRQAWQISWVGHILLTDPSRLWQSNAFYPQPNNFAYGDSLLGYGPIGMLGHGPIAATLRYNILFVLAHAFLFLGGYALVRQLGGGRTGAAVAAAAFAYAPWRLAQEGHLDIISAGGIPLALAMLARGHGWSLRRGLRSSESNVGWLAFGWLVAAWQVTLGFSLGLPFLGVLGIVLLVLLIGTPILWLRRRARRPILGWRLIITDVLGALIVVGIAALVAIPYFKVSDSSSNLAEIKFFSPPLRSLLISPSESSLWGSAHAVPRSSLRWPAEMTLLPGFVLYALALAGLFFSVWKLWQRLALLAATVVVAILTLGTNFFRGHWTYLPLFEHLPASLGVRIPGRLMLWVTLLLGILAAGAVSEFVERAEQWSAQRIPPWPAWWLRLATLVPLVLVLAEGWNGTAHPVVPDQPSTMRTVSGPMLVLPTGAVTDETVMLWSTSRYQKIANGSGGFAATRQAELYQKVASFPDVASIDYLRSINVTTVLLLRSQVAGTPWERAGDTPVDTLGITREDADNAVIFRLG